MIKENYDKILLGISLALLAGAFLFAATRPDARPVTEFIDIVPIGEHNTYKVSELREPDLTIPQWQGPRPQSTGEEWVFDLFTPPDIYFSEATGTFEVVPPDEEPPEPFGIRLVDVEETLYRIQLVGFHGRAGDYLLNLRDEEGRDDVLAREGETYPDLEIEVREVDVETRRIQHEGETEVIERVAHAVIYDQRLRREVSLSSDKRRIAEEKLARFVATLEAYQDEEITATEGESFELGNYTYHVVEMTPTGVTVNRRSPDPDEPSRTETFDILGLEEVAAEEPDEEAAEEGLEDEGADIAEGQDGNFPGNADGQSSEGSTEDSDDP